MMFPSKQSGPSPFVEIRLSRCFLDALGTEQRSGVYPLLDHIDILQLIVEVFAGLHVVGPSVDLREILSYRLVD